MSWDVSPPARRRGWLLLAGAAVLLLAGAAAFVGLRRGAAPPGAAAGSSSPPSASAATDAVAAAVPGPAALRLPAPRLAAGSPVIPLGFPHTALGAASAAWRWTQAMYGLDPPRASAAAAACADPTFGDAPARAAQTALAVRASLGVAATGPATPAYLVVTPRMVQVIDPDPDFPVVDVLTTADLGNAAGARLHRVQVLELHLHWAATAGGGDYRLLDRDGDATRMAGRTADPDNPAAARLGWRDVVLLGAPR
jgi:hypothetical protein